MIMRVMQVVTGIFLFEILINIPRTSFIYASAFIRVSKIFGIGGEASVNRIITLMM